MKKNSRVKEANVPDVREQAAVLALVSVTKGSWHQTASMIEEVGVKRFLRREWTGFETFDVKAAEALVEKLPPNAVDHYVDEITRLASQGVQTITVLDPEYPVNLRAIFNRPPMLFVKGRLVEADEKGVAVVGTRQATDDGLRQAYELARELARRGITVLSGLARGIDTAAHEGALAARGRTIAVMGTGISYKIYPPENVDLAKRVQGAGALVSQFWPDSPPRGTNFPMRNVVMSGMAVGTVVVEAGPTSGAKMQARLALEHGKRVFLMESLVMTQPWAQRYRKHPAVTVITAADKVADLVEALVRAPGQLTLS
jgi:DNA processing protein